MTGSLQLSKLLGQQIFVSSSHESSSTMILSIAFTAKSTASRSVCGTEKAFDHSLNLLNEWHGFTLRIPIMLPCLIKSSQGVKLGSEYRVPWLFPLPSEMKWSIKSVNSGYFPWVRLPTESWLWYLSSVLVLWLISTTYYPKDHRIKLSPHLVDFHTLTFFTYKSTTPAPYPKSLLHMFCTFSTF